MPHIVIEYSRDGHRDRFDAQTLMHALHHTAADTGVMKADDIKVRAIPYEDYLVAGRRQGFCHVSVHLLAGRTGEQKVRLSSAIRATLSDLLPHTESLSVDIVDMDPESYKKRLLT